AEGVGYLLKDRITDVSELGDAVRRVAAGGTVMDPQVISRLLGRRRDRDALEALTREERTMLGMLARGLSHRAVAERMELPGDEVEERLARIFRKLGLESDSGGHQRVQAVLAYLRA